MSVYIEGIELPTPPDELRLIIRPNGQVIICHRTEWDETEAVNVPPHGRLIDADELKKFPIRRDHYDKEHGDEHFINGIETVMEFIDYVPTVIEAEVGE